MFGGLMILVLVGMMVILVVNEIKNNQEDKLAEEMAAAKPVYLFETDVIALKSFTKGQVGYKFEKKYKLDITIVNKSDKIIKYITFGIVCINPVNDICDIKNLKAIGPISVNGVAECKWNDIHFYNEHITKSTCIRSFIIEYMDGTNEVIFVK